MKLSPQIDLFVFVDALGWKLVEEHGFLSDLLPRRSPCETVFGYSSTCDPTILTGAQPRDHGHFSCFVKAEAGRSPFRKLGLLRFFPEAIAAHHRLRTRLSRLVAKKLDITGYFQLYSVPFGCLPYLDYTEKKDIYAPGGILGGQRNIFETWEELGRAWVRSDWRRSDEENIGVIKTEIARGEIELAYLFTAKLDACLHRYGVSHPESVRCLDWFAAQIRDLHTAASKRYRDVRIHVFSDHGMSDTHRTSDLMLRWNRACPFRYGKDYVAVWDATMARFWFEEPGARTWARKFLADQPEGRIVTDAELVAWGCDFPDNRYGELIYLLPPGSIFAPSFMNRGFVTGMHGYDPDHEECSACWLTNHDHYSAPAHLSDIYEVMEWAAKYRGKTSRRPLHLLGKKEALSA